MAHAASFAVCRIGLIAWLFCLALGCTPGAVRPMLIDRLKNRGVIPLSASNPYLAANLLLAKEAKDSPDLQGFLNSRGTPAALELTKEFWGPLTLYLYYPKGNEYFMAEQAVDGWIIRGPGVTPLEKRVELEQTVKTSDSAPPLALSPAANSNGEQRDQLKQEPTAPASVTSAPPASPTPVVSFESPLPKASPGPSANTMRTEADPALEKIISEGGGHPAETTPKGDIVHYVTYPGETLSMLARWYTKDPSNAGRIGRINQVAPPYTLKIGDTIIIPAYMVKNKNRMSDRAVRELAALAGSTTGRKK